MDERGITCDPGRGVGVDVGIAVGGTGVLVAVSATTSVGVLASVGVPPQALMVKRTIKHTTQNWGFEETSIVLSSWQWCVVNDAIVTYSNTMRC
jgi:hypothetical protein